MINFKEAVALLVQAARPLAAERVPLERAHGRTLAAAVVARLDSPRTDVSVMDGYAVRRADLPGMLRVVGESYPGAPHDTSLPAACAVRIFTGAPIPSGADQVVMQENVTREGDRVHVREQPTDIFIRKARSDFARGDALLPKGQRMTPAALMAAAAADIAELEVFGRPRIRLLATGDELAEPGVAADRLGLIPDSISAAVAALAAEWGAEPLGVTRLPDDLPRLQAALPALLEGSDVLIVTGGASVGERDFARAMFGDALHLIFAKVRIKPGKPVWLGQVGETLVLGLPGNPTSAFVTARLFLAPIIAALSGRDPTDALAWEYWPIAEQLPPPGNRETFSRATLQHGRLVLASNQDSGAQATLVQTDWLVRRSAGEQGFAAGDLVQALRL